MILRFTYILFFSLALLTCKDNSNENYSFIGGEIINPIDKNLTVFKSSDIREKIILDENNRFLTKINNLKTGFYGFSHGNEYQLFFLEPKDSIILRVNTIDFDESLSFSGVGSKKNNYLINLFTKYENSKSDVFTNLYKLNPTEFIEKLDSIKNKELKNLDRFINSTNTSDIFEQVARNSINYIFNSKKESYIFIDSNYEKDVLYPDNFYAYRNDINYNNNFLKDFYHYYNFLFPHFNNLAYQKFTSIYDKNTYKRNNVDYNLIKLKLIDSLVIDNEIKLRLSSFVTRNFLSFNKRSQANADKVYNKFIEINKVEDSEKNQNSLDRVTNLYNSLRKLKSGNKLPLIELVNTNKTPISINMAVKNKSVLCFWSMNSKNSFKDSHNKINKLKDKNPNIDFISINIDNIEKEKWLKNLYNKYKKCECGDNFDNEYKLQNVDIAMQLLGIQYIRKTIIIDKDLNIIESNANLFSKDFSSLLD